jgi:phospholipase D1/2
MSESQRPPTLLREGATCWRTAHADRAAFLVDGEAFFAALADALERARHRVWLLGWDFHSAIRLRRNGGSERPDELVPLLDGLVRERRSLHVHVLAWDFAMLYALEREFLPLLHFGARTHRRVHFEMDSAHPVAASQHQKLVVIDDAIAFAGGLDLTTDRWDTRAHAPADPRRVAPNGKPYAPFHDVQGIGRSSCVFARRPSMGVSIGPERNPDRSIHLDGSVRRLLWVPCN